MLKTSYGHCVVKIEPERRVIKFKFVGTAYKNAESCQMRICGVVSAVYLYITWMY